MACLAAGGVTGLEVTGRNTAFNVPSMAGKLSIGERAGAGVERAKCAGFCAGANGAELSC